MPGEPDAARERAAGESGTGELFRGSRMAPGELQECSPLPRSPPKGLSEKLLGGKLEQWKQPKIFSTPKPCFSCYHQRLQGGDRGPRELVLTSFCLWTCGYEDLDPHSSLSSSTGFPDPKSCGF